MFDNILTVIAAISSLAGFVAAAKGATRTQARLQRGNERDAFIDAMAWADRHILRGRPVIIKP